jgi:NADPH-dependent 2,4-dienoyl-CoA reductase/sulfur reductase-like enzyme
MRQQLYERDGERFRIRTTVSRMGVRPTVLLIDGVDVTSGEKLFDHLWLKTGIWARIPMGDDWRAMRPGDVIEFDARSGQYLKGYFGRKESINRPLELDWTVMRPTNLTLIYDALKGSAP